MGRCARSNANICDNKVRSEDAFKSLPPQGLVSTHHWLGSRKSRRFRKCSKMVEVYKAIPYLIEG